MIHNHAGLPAAKMKANGNSQTRERMNKAKTKGKDNACGPDHFKVGRAAIRGTTIRSVEHLEQRKSREAGPHSGLKREATGLHTGPAAETHKDVRNGDAEEGKQNKCRQCCDAHAEWDLGHHPGTAQCTRCRGIHWHGPIVAIPGKHHGQAWHRIESAHTSAICGGDAGTARSCFGYEPAENPIHGPKR